MTTTPTSGAADLPEALRVPLDSLHADAGYLCGRLLNGSLTQEQVVESIRRRIDAAKLAAITAEPAEHVQNPAENEHVAGDVSGNGAGLNMSTPHARITELESQLAQRFDAADMATAAAQGFRAGVASLSLTAAGQEPVAWLYEHKLLGTKQAFTTEPPPGLKEKCTPLYSHPSPPEGMAGWRPTSEMRAVVAVAVTMLYEKYPEDVLRVFDLCELEKISSITGLLGSQQVEDIYRSAWDHLTAPPIASEAKEPK